MGAVGSGAPGGVVMVRDAHCLTCGDVEADRDLKCPRCGAICPAAGAGRIRPRAALKGAVVVAPASGAVDAGPDVSVMIVMPASGAALRWRRETERLLAAHEERREGIREAIGPLRTEDAQLARSIAALKQVLARIQVAEGAVAADPVGGKRWSRKYDRCQAPDCRTPESVHAARGICAACVARAKAAARRQG